MAAFPSIASLLQDNRFRKSKNLVKKIFHPAGCYGKSVRDSLFILTYFALR
jgi:hypothetical protein